MTVKLASIDLQHLEVYPIELIYSILSGFLTISYVEDASQHFHIRRLFFYTTLSIAVLKYYHVEIHDKDVSIRLHSRWTSSIECSPANPL